MKLDLLEGGTGVAHESSLVTKGELGKRFLLTELQQFITYELFSNAWSSATSQPGLSLWTESLSHNVNCLTWNFGHKRTFLCLPFFFSPLTDLYLRIVFFLRNVTNFSV